MSNKTNEEIESFKEKVKKDAEELVLKKFPQKILDLELMSCLEKFLPNVEFKTLDINILIPKSHSEEGLADKPTQHKPKETELNLEDEDLIITKPFLFPNGVIECNKELIEMIDILKPKLLELMEDIFVLKLAVNLMIPKIEDGNNFGVDIQHETIGALSGVEGKVLDSFDSFGSYFQSRGDIIAKVAKYPHNQDFRNALQERDKKFHLFLCMTLTDVRNHYVSLHDLVTKNLTKLKQPRTTDNKESLY